MLRPCECNCVSLDLFSAALILKMPCLLRTEDIYIGLDVLERIVDGSEKPSKLKFSLLELITKKISDELKLANGGCGVVYKVTFSLHCQFRYNGA